MMAPPGAPRRLAFAASRLWRRAASSSSAATATLLYQSRPPQLVLIAARAVALQALASAFIAASLVRRALLAAPADGPAAVAELALRLATGSLGAGLSEALQQLLLVQPSAAAELQASAGLAALSVCGVLLARGMAARIVTKLERLDGAEGEVRIRITRPSLLPGLAASSTTHTRADEGSAGGAVGGEGAWTSDDLPYLKKLLYADYARPDERAPQPDRLLIDVRGFGPYRPAQFADPAHAAFALVLGSSGEGTALPPHVGDGGPLADTVGDALAALDAEDAAAAARLQALMARQQQQAQTVQAQAQTPMKTQAQMQRPVSGTSPGLRLLRGAVFADFLQPAALSPEQWRALESKRELARARRALATSPDTAASAAEGTEAAATAARERELVAAEAAMPARLLPSIDPRAADVAAQAADEARGTVS